MSSPLTRLQARIAGQIGRERMGERFAAQVKYEAVPVAGPGLARVYGQLVDSTVGEEKSAGDLVAMANVGRPAAALYSPQGGAAVVMASSSGGGVAAGGVTVHAQLSGLGADDHQHYLNIERGDARYYTEVEEDAWRAAHIGDPDIHHKHATVAAPLSIDANQYIALLYNSTLLVDGSSKLGVNPGYNFAWTNSHNWAMDTTLSSAGTVIPPGVTTGYGWSIVNPSSGDATLTIPNIYVGNLHAQTFIADAARVDVGEEVWTRSRAMLAEAFTVPPLNTSRLMVVEVPPGVDGSMLHLFGNSHFVRLRIFDSTQGLTIADAWGTVAFESYTPPDTESTPGRPALQTYTFQMLYGSAGAVLPPGALVMGYGTPGDSFVLVTVIKDGAPYTAYYRWGLNADGSVLATAKPWEAQYWKLLTRIGNLEGQVDTAFGGALHGAGLYSENVYLKGRIQIAAGSDVPWSAVSGSGRPEDNATYGATWSQVSGPGKPQDDATYGATWGVNMQPPGYLQAPGNGSAPGLYLLGTRLGFWNGSWRTYLDDAGNFIFTGPGVEQTSIAEGTTRLAYLSTPGILGGQVYRSGLWRKTWWTDNATGAMYAGEDGEVLLHEHGLSMLAYTGSEIAPTYNTKAVGFFASGDQITNVNKARARIWGGYNMDPAAVGGYDIVRSMLQLEIGIDGDGVIASNNRPSLQLQYIPAAAVFGLSKQFIVNGFNLIQFQNEREGLQPSLFVVIADQTTLMNKTMVDQLLPGSSVKTIGAANSKFEAVYAKTIYADAVIAPSFTGQNTVGTELRADNYPHNTGNWHAWGTSQNWSAPHNDGFFNPAVQTRMTVDATGFYRISYSVTFSVAEHTSFVRVYAANGSSYYDTLHSRTQGGLATAAGDLYLSAGQYITLYSEPGNGFTVGNYARFSVVRTGTNGVPTTTSVWTAADAVFVRSNSASSTNLRVENSNAGARMNLSVEGEITSELGLYNGVNLAVLGQEWSAHKAAADPHPQYMLKAQVQQVYATQDALTAAVANGMGGGGGETYHNALTGLTDGDPHTQYVALAFNRTITAQHTFNPPSAGPAFLLGPNASGRLVVGLNADVLDGHHWDELALTSAEILTALLQVDGSGSLLDADLLDGAHAAEFASSGLIVGAGAGLSGGGVLTGSISLAVGAGLGIEVGDDTVSLASSVAGAGLLYDAGVLTVRSGAGLRTTPYEVEVDTEYGFYWTGPHMFMTDMNTSNLLPLAPDTYDIGTSELWYRQQFVSKINASVFAIKNVHLYGGWLMVPKAAGVFADVGAGETYLYFAGATLNEPVELEAGDYVLVRGLDAAGVPSTEYMKIVEASSDAGFHWVQRDVAGLGAIPQWPGSTSYVVLGQDGDGRVEINSYDSPRISVIKQGVNYNDQTTLVRIGDLQGMPGVNVQTWGIYIGTASQHLKFDGATLTIAGNGSGITNIDGGKITTGTISADRITAVSLAAVRANIDKLSTLRADMGAITAGSIVVGSTNKLWLNDSNDGALAIGGTVKASAPFRVSGDGSAVITLKNGTATWATLSNSGLSLVRKDVDASGSPKSYNWEGRAGLEWYQSSVTGNEADVAGYFAMYRTVNEQGLGTNTNCLYLEVKTLGANRAFIHVGVPGTGMTLATDGMSLGVAGTYSLLSDDISLRTGDFTNKSDTFVVRGLWDNDTGCLTRIYTMPGAVIANAGGTRTLEVFQERAGADAFMNFHVSSDYAVSFGLSGANNDLYVGGWSMGATTKYKIWHQGNLAIGAAGAWWGKMGYIGSDGVMEIGKYLDFHATNAGTEDNSVRLTGTAGLLTCNAPFEVASSTHYCGTFTGQGVTGQTYAYINLTYQSARSGYLLWNSGGVQLNADPGKDVTLSAGGNAYISASACAINTTVWGGAALAVGGIVALNTASGWAVFGPQNTSYCHMTTDRANFWFDHSIVIQGNLGSYNADMYISRAGTNRIALFSWGTYVYNHLTMEDVFAILNTQGSAPNNPASGVKVFLTVIGGVTYLQARFANGTTRNICNS